MAITKIKSLKGNIQNSINYIVNEDKTLDKLLVSSFGTTPETAGNDFKIDQFKYANGDIKKVQKGNQAYHLIQSFKPNEVNADVAHQIGIEYADAVLKGKHHYIIATHVDKDSIHNHIIFCSADIFGKNRYHNCTSETLNRMQTNDRICKKYGLSVIDNKIVKGKNKHSRKKYNEWKASKKGIDWKGKLREDIDLAIECSSSYENFIRDMESRGYIVNDTGKYIKFLPEGRERVIRGSQKILGSEYTRQRIKERISEFSIDIKRETSNSFVEEMPKIIDTSTVQMDKSFGLKRWANRKNLQSADTLFNIARKIGFKNLSSLREFVENGEHTLNDIQLEISNLQEEILKNNETLKLCDDYIKNKKYLWGYNKAIDKDKFKKEHYQQLISYYNAEYFFSNKGIIPNESFFDMVYNNNILKEKELEKLQKDLENTKEKLEVAKEINNQFNMYLNKSKSNNIDIN